MKMSGGVEAWLNTFSKKIFMNLLGDSLLLIKKLCY